MTKLYTPLWSCGGLNSCCFWKLTQRLSKFQPSPSRIVSRQGAPYASMWLSINEGSSSVTNSLSRGESPSSLMDLLMLPANSGFMSSGCSRASLTTFHMLSTTSSGSCPSTTPTFGKFRCIKSTVYPSNVAMRASAASNAVDNSCTALIKGMTYISLEIF